MRVFTKHTRVSVLLISSYLSISAFTTEATVSAGVIPPLRSQKSMVVSGHPLASEAGLQMLGKGGNAVDAAVATTLTIAVVEPFAAGIGGGGFLLFHNGKTGEIQALDFRERAPQKATKNMYLDAQGKVIPLMSVNGHLAVGTPGTVAGLHEIHRRYGKLPWQEVVQPAIALAENGFILGKKNTWRSMAGYTKMRKEAILNNPAATAIFLRNGDFYQPGEKLVQRDLGKTLREIASNPRNFYTGSIAQAIASDMKKHGGLITLDDLKNYQPIWRKPVCGNFRQARVCSMPPPSSGGVHLLQMLNILAGTDWKTLGWHHPDAVHLLAETMKIAYSDRSQLLGDPDFVTVPVEKLISPAYGKKRRGEITMNRAKPSTQVKPTDEKTLPKIPESLETSHLNVVDAQRNAVSLTFTINTGFGAGVVAAGTGILLNNEMDDFAAAPGVPNAFGLVGSQKNAIAPRKTPLSSMTPTIITEKGQLRMLVGTPGGGTIITQVLQVILNVWEYGMDAGQAVAAPRIHHQWLPDELRIEPLGMDTMTLQELRRRGHNIKEITPWGNINAIIVTPEGTLEGAADPRGEGEARGL